MSWPILSWIVFLPMVGALVILFINGSRHNAIRWTSLLFTIANFVLSLVLFARFEGSNSGMQFRNEPVIWIKSLGITYSLGVDGISILLVVLTPFLTAIAIASAWTAIKEKVNRKPCSRRKDRQSFILCFCYFIPVVSLSI